MQKIVTAPIQPINGAIAIIGSLLLGTGTAYLVDRLESWEPLLRHRVSLTFDDAPASPASGISRADVRTAREHIENIRRVLNPSVSDLASIFEVSRQAIYKWLSSDSTPEAEKLPRIRDLSRIADAIGSSGIARTSALLKLKAFDGRSLLDLFKSGEYQQAHVTALIKEAETMESSYAASGLSSSKALPTSDWQASVSIPSSSERV